MTAALEGARVSVLGAVLVPLALAGSLAALWATGARGL